MVRVEVEPVRDYMDANGMMNCLGPSELLTRVKCESLLAEKRPCIQRGDKVIASRPGEGSSQWEGFVYIVTHNALLLLFGTEFHTAQPTPTQMNLSFSVERLTHRLMHRAVDEVRLSVAWPSGSAASADTSEKLPDEDDTIAASLRVSGADTSETLPARCTRGHFRDTSLAARACEGGPPRYPNPPSPPPTVPEPTLP